MEPQATSAPEGVRIFLSIGVDGYRERAYCCVCRAQKGYPPTHPRVLEMLPAERGGQWKLCSPPSPLQHYQNSEEAEQLQLEKGCQGLRMLVKAAEAAKIPVTSGRAAGYEMWEATPVKGPRKAMAARMLQTQGDVTFNSQLWLVESPGCRERSGQANVEHPGSSLPATHAAMLQGRHLPVSFSSPSASTGHPGVSAWTGALARGRLEKVPRGAQYDLHVVSPKSVAGLGVGIFHKTSWSSAGGAWCARAVAQPQAIRRQEEHFRAPLLTPSLLPCREGNGPACLTQSMPEASPTRQEPFLRRNRFAPACPPPPSLFEGWGQWPRTCPSAAEPESADGWRGREVG
ncbi:hypothetical protein P7K49_009436 [Saguinus oedipus]|uniref:Uncharacterized protein n=1 Tax=Saguinus oedipus TaxID=9490 RepID=A0ABQ9VKK3_SAGOE|nr:hypothetical protein P7K49_009436 [Saguinus oedipus]